MQHDHILKKLILYKPIQPLQLGQYRTQGHNLNKLGRGLLECYSQNIKAVGLVVSDKMIFHVFPVYANVKHVSPRAVPILVTGT